MTQEHLNGPRCPACAGRVWKRHGSEGSRAWRCTACGARCLLEESGVMALDPPSTPLAGSEDGRVSDPGGPDLRQADIQRLVCDLIHRGRG